MRDGFLKNNINQFSVIYRIVDFTVIQLILFFSCFLHDILTSERYFIVSLVASTCYFLMSEVVRLYRSWRTSSVYRLLLCTVICWVSASFGVVLFIFFSKIGVEFSRITIGTWFLLCGLALIGWRLMFRWTLFYFRRRGFNTRTVAVLGLSADGLRVAEQIFDKPETGIRLIGFFDDRKPERISEKFHHLLLGNVKEGVERAKNAEFDIIYIALPIGDKERLSVILKQLGNTTVDVHFVPDFLIFNLINSRLAYLGSMQTLSVFESPLRGPSNLMKRVEDIVISLVILTMISPLLLLISMLIKLDSKGPVFFKQSRYGEDGKEIKVYKFRSMKVLDDGAVVKQATKGDSRITRIGAFLRRTSLDELPQFINVLQGSMSIVGPRPHAVAHNEEYRTKVDFYMLRHKIKPGITGWAQINGWRGETDTIEKMEKRIEFDLEYMRNWSILLDIEIIFLTIFKGFINKNAY